MCVCTPFTLRSLLMQQKNRFQRCSAVYSLYQCGKGHTKFRHLNIQRLLSNLHLQRRPSRPPLLPAHIHHVLGVAWYVLCHLLPCFPAAPGQIFLLEELQHLITTGDTGTSQGISLFRFPDTLTSDRILFWHKDSRVSRERKHKLKPKVAVLSLLC